MNATNRRGVSQQSKRKRQRTRYIWLSQAGNFAYFRVGIIYNKKGGIPEDIIRVEFINLKDKSHCWITDMRVDEAMHLIAGLSKTLATLMWGGKRQAEMFVRSAKMNVELKEGEENHEA